MSVPIKDGKKDDSIASRKTTFRMNDYYLCTVQDNSEIVKKYECSVYDSFEQADKYYIDEVGLDKHGTMFSVSHFMPKFMRPYYLKYKLTNIFIKIEEK